MTLLQFRHYNTGNPVYIVKEKICGISYVTDQHTEIITVGRYSYLVKGDVENIKNIIQNGQAGQSG